MLHQDTDVRGTQRTCGQNELQFFDLEYLRASEARIARPAGDHQGENHFANARSEKRGERNGQQNSWERQKRVDQQQIYEAVEPATSVTGKHPDDESGESAAANYGNRNE